ncbi:hypothetical protein VNO77_22106 [Canavalia gladiata]|uniref:BHLH domain-containing protein n=1 Tax=Canavalia gladiata TaxID=3824 RepID=A0AAN9L4J9_CANGL
MAEEFQAAVCGENWWNINSTRSVFPLMMSSASTCSVAAADAGNYSTWQTDFMELKGLRSFAEETNDLVSDSSLGFLDAEKPQQSELSSGTGSISMDSTLQMMGFGMSSSTSSNWNQPLLQESSFHSVLQEETGIGGGSNSQIQVSTVDAFKSMNQEFSLDQQSLNSVTNTGLTGGFPAGSDSYGYPSTLIQSLYDPKPQPQPQPQPQNSLFTNPTMSYSSATNYATCSNKLSPTWSKVSSPLKLSIPKQQLGGLHFSNNNPSWNASAEALNDIRSGVFPSSQPQYQMPKFEDKSNSPNTQLNKLKREESPDSTSATKKNSSEPAFKRPRVETPSPLPTFKVRKERLGDRITALQQLVSPFGKTDTASVLHEAIEYIKFLHDQVSVLSTPYMKNGAPIQQQQGCENVKDTEGPKQDLRSRGLCLVPISSTFPVANETAIDFWTPTFGGALIGR